LALITGITSYDLFAGLTWRIKELYSLQDKFGLHPCGENGEYHTFIVDGPIFKEQIDIPDVDKKLQQGQ
jgi:diphthine-ammonia ligase